MSNHGRFKRALKRKAIETNDIIAFSHHEAGHTIYAFLKFMKVHEVGVFVNRKGQVEGNTDYETPCDEKFEENCADPALLDFWVKSEVGLAYSGNAAERHYFKLLTGQDKLPLFLKDGSSDDITSAADLIKRYNLAPPGQKRYAFKQRTIKKTMELLIECWDDVVLVSHALYERKKLDYAALKDLLSKKSANKEFWKAQFKEIDYLFDHELDIEERRHILVGS